MLCVKYLCAKNASQIIFAEENNYSGRNLVLRQKWAGSFGFNIKFFYTQIFPGVAPCVTHFPYYVGIWSMNEEVVFSEIWVKSLYLAGFWPFWPWLKWPKIGNMSQSRTSSFIGQFAPEFLREPQRGSTSFTQQLWGKLAYKRRSSTFRQIAYFGSFGHGQKPAKYSDFTQISENTTSSFMDHIPT